MFYVYLLNGSDRRTYVGCTNDLKDRMSRHQAGHVSATKGKRPLELFAYVALREKDRAYKFEKYLKTGSGRAFLKRHFLG